MKKRDIVINGVRVRVVETGEGDPLLLVHGWAASGKFWKNNVPELSNRYRCIVVDLPGYGESAKPANFAYTIENYGESLLGLLNALDLPKVSLMGHSMGGMISLDLALKHPDRVNKLILVCAPVQGKTALFPHARFLALPSIKEISFTLSRARSLRLFVSRSLGFIAKLDPELSEELALATFESLFGSIISIVRTDLSKRLKHLRAPALVCYSDGDPVIRYQQYEILLKGMARGCRFECFYGCGHYPMIERAEAFNNLIETFLSGKS